MILIKMAQIDCPVKVINKMRNNNAIFQQVVLEGLPRKRPRQLMQVIKYIPFLDSNGLLRVGGRLQNSKFDIHSKHPVIIPIGTVSLNYTSKSSTYNADI